LLARFADELSAIKFTDAAALKWEMEVNLIQSSIKDRVILDYNSLIGESTNDVKASDLELSKEHEILKFHSLMPEIIEEGSEREGTLVTNAKDDSSIHQSPSTDS